MYYGKIKNCDIANGTGVRVSLFVSGCRNRCEGCFQPETWDFSYGQPFMEETENELLTLLKPDYIQGLSLLGGEPMEPENQHCLLPFLRRVRTAYPQKNIWCFTGYRYENLLSDAGEILSFIDVLVDGPFVLTEKDIALRFRGSRNQRLIDLNATRQTGKIQLLPETRRKTQI